MFLFKNKEIKKNIIIFLKVIFFIILIYFAKDFFSKNEIIKISKKISIFEVLFLLAPILIILMLMSLRWFYVVNSFSSQKFKEYFKNIIIGFNISLISSSTVAIDVVKYIQVKKEFSHKKSFYFIIYDKLITLAVRIISILFFINILNFMSFKAYEITILIISIIISFLTIFFFSKTFSVFLKKFNFLTFFEFFIEILNRNSKKLTILFFINFSIQFLVIFIYAFAFSILDDKIPFFNVALITPIVEIFSQLQVLFPGAKEAFTVFIYSTVNVDNNTSLIVAILVRVLEFLVGIILFLLSFLIKSKKY